MKSLVPLNVNAVFSDVEIAPPYSAELLMKLLVPLKLNTVLSDV